MSEEQDRNAVCRVELSGRAYKIIQRKMVSTPKWYWHYFEFNDHMQRVFYFYGIK